MIAPDSLDILGSPGKIEEPGSPSMRDFRYAPTPVGGIYTSLRQVADAPKPERKHLASYSLRAVCPLISAFFIISAASTSFMVQISLNGRFVDWLSGCYDTNIT